MKRLLWLGVTLFMTACSSIPEEIQTPEDSNLVSYQAVLGNAEAFTGKTARWGGMIAAVRNTNFGTEIEVVNLNLQSWGRPVPSDKSDGRFRAKLDGFIDPMVYKEGRYITFRGIVAEAETGTIDEFKYLFPVLKVTGKYLWPVQKEKTRVEVDYSSLWYRHYYYTRPYYRSPVYYPGPVMKHGSQQKKDQQ